MKNIHELYNNSNSSTVIKGRICGHYTESTQHLAAIYLPNPVQNGRNMGSIYSVVYS